MRPIFGGPRNVLGGTGCAFLEMFVEQFDSVNKQLFQIGLQLCAVLITMPTMYTLEVITNVSDASLEGFQLKSKWKLLRCFYTLPKLTTLVLNVVGIRSLEVGEYHLSGNLVASTYASFITCVAVLPLCICMHKLFLPGEHFRTAVTVELHPDGASQSTRLSIAIGHDSTYPLGSQGMLGHDSTYPVGSQGMLSHDSTYPVDRGPRTEQGMKGGRGEGVGVAPALHSTHNNLVQFCPLCGERLLLDANNRFGLKSKSFTATKAAYPSASLSTGQADLVTDTELAVEAAEEASSAVPVAEAAGDAIPALDPATTATASEAAHMLDSVLATTAIEERPTSDSPTTLNAAEISSTTTATAAEAS
ncbi:hypothetical protein CYMTET_18801 [Cymbomonas tetramitiformis]|uniref:Uncharacterized protein n=1 Tax=Cymbomonas tetramitiformis TaxID=36881 RepID=A0AAE0G7C5_9CHLO|nr:hypothetical protein CYMTET_18801 [Cymbomonas tetramitiformis]